MKADARSGLPIICLFSARVFADNVDYLSIN